MRCLEAAGGLLAAVAQLSSCRDNDVDAALGGLNVDNGGAINPLMDPAHCRYRHDYTTDSWIAI